MKFKKEELVNIILRKDADFANAKNKVTSVDNSLFLRIGSWIDIDRGLTELITAK